MSSHITVLIAIAVQFGMDIWPGIAKRKFTLREQEAGLTLLVALCFVSLCLSLSLSLYIYIYLSLSLAFSLSLSSMLFHSCLECIILRFGPPFPSPQNSQHLACLSVFLPFAGTRPPKPSKSSLPQEIQKEACGKC